VKNIKYDIAIVGGGIVGLSTAYKIQKKYPKLNLIILEKEKELAFHQTGRNSGVIHSGLYYKPDSYRSKYCVDGRNQLIKFAKENNISHDICGKIILAVSNKEVNQLVDLKKIGEKNGLSNLEIIDMKKAKEIEPYAEGHSALFVPQSGVIDYKGVAKKFAELIKNINHNSKIETNCEVLDIEYEKLFSTKGIVNTSHSIFCGGLFSDRLAKKDCLKLKMKIVGFRGDYYELKEKSRHKVKNLIYPVPNPEFPFLGVHFTRMTDGSIECGPNAVFTFKREGYKKTDFSFKDSWDALTFSGTWKLFINHWKFGLNEYRRAFSKRLFLKELKKMIPSLTMNDIKVGRSGVRAMALANNGEVIDDFMIVKNDKNIHVLNAPSPAATSCLAIADEITEQASNSFDLNNK